MISVLTMSSIAGVMAPKRGRVEKEAESEEGGADQAQLGKKKLTVYRPSVSNNIFYGFLFIELLLSNIFDFTFYSVTICVCIISFTHSCITQLRSYSGVQPWDLLVRCFVARGAVVSIMEGIVQIGSGTQFVLDMVETVTLTIHVCGLML